MVWTEGADPATSSFWVTFLSCGAVSAGISLVGKLLVDRSATKHKAELSAQVEREVVQLKSKLANSEHLWKAQLETYRAFDAIYDSMLPGYHPHDDSDDFHKHVSENLDTHDKQLKEFLLEHGATLPRPLLKMVESAHWEAQEGAFEHSQPGGHRYGADFATKMTAIKEQMHDTIHGQTAS